MKLSKLSFLALLVAPFLTNCADFNDQSVQPLDSGSADFTKYVAVGNSLAAGFQSNALYPEGQLYSYPNMLAQQMRVDQFALPEIGNGYGDLIVAANFTAGRTGIVTATQRLVPNVSPTQPEGGYQNLGIPGAVLNDYLGTARVDALGNSTPYANRFAASPSYAFVLGTTPTPINTYLDAQNPTFVSFWLGNNDVLGYVTSGGLRAFTNPSNFQTEFGSAIGAIMAQDANIKGVVANIPGVTSIPFTTFVGQRAKPLLVGNLTASGIPANMQNIYIQASFTPSQPAIAMRENRSPFSAMNAAHFDNVDSVLVLLTAQTALTWIAASDANPADAERVAQIVGYWKSFLVASGAVADAATANAMSVAQVEQTLNGVTYSLYASTFGGTPQEAAVALGGYSFDFSQPFGLHPSNPFPSQFILDKNEILVANAVTNTFNTIIAGTVNAFNTRLGLVDVNDIFADIVAAGGTVQDGVALAPALGSLFSFDGVHPSNRGHGLVTNAFIDVINAKFGTAIPKVNISWIPSGLTVSDDPM
jgi:hypothetical protein